MTQADRDIHEALECAILALEDCSDLCQSKAAAKGLRKYATTLKVFLAGRKERLAYLITKDGTQE